MFKQITYVRGKKLSTLKFCVMQTAVPYVNCNM